MKSVVSILLLGAAIVGFQFNAEAQSYISSAGIRLGKSNQSRQIGLTVKHRFLKDYTGEAILQSDLRDNTSLHVLLEKHHPLIGKRLNWYWGGGMSFGNEESVIRDPESNQKITTYGNSTIGIDAVAGVEMTLLRFNISLDVKPNINLAGRDNFILWQTGLSVRTVLTTPREARRNKRQRNRERHRDVKS